jgi:hypothetical protein
MNRRGQFITAAQFAEAQSAGLRFVIELMALAPRIDPEIADASVVALGVQSMLRAYVSSGGDEADTVLGLARATAAICAQQADPAANAEDFILLFQAELAECREALQATRV